MKNNLIMTAIYAFSVFCLFVAWSRYHDDWSAFRETVHLGAMFSLYLAAVVSALAAGWARRRENKPKGK